MADRPASDATDRLDPDLRSALDLLGLDLESLDSLDALLAGPHPEGPRNGHHSGLQRLVTCGLARSVGGGVEAVDPTSWLRQRLAPPDESEDGPAGYWAAPAPDLDPPPTGLEAIGAADGTPLRRVLVGAAEHSLWVATSDVAALSTCASELGAALAGGVDARLVLTGGADVGASDTAAGPHPLDDWVTAGLRLRVMPVTPVSLLLVDDRWCLLSDASSGDDLLVHPGPLLTGMAALFEGWWARAIPTDAGPPTTSDHGIDDRLIGLLLMGLSDDAVARRLQTSLRTVQRRVAALMRESGAHTRLQLGMQTALRRIGSARSSSA